MRALAMTIIVDTRGAYAATRRDSADLRRYAARRQRYPRGGALLRSRVTCLLAKIEWRSSVMRAGVVARSCYADYSVKTSLRVQRRESAAALLRADAPWRTPLTRARFALARQHAAVRH